MNTIQSTDFFENQSYSFQRDEIADLRQRFRKLLDDKIQADNDLKRIEDYSEIKRYLDGGEQHNSEGRDLGFQKESFSISELIFANKLQDEESIINYLLYRYRFNSYPRKKVKNNFPIVLCIEPTSICNLRCTMCFQSDKDFANDKRLQGHMSLELFKKIIDEAKEYNLASIVLASRGEPLLNKQIFEMIKYAKDNGIIDVKLNTNATMLNENASRKLIEAGLDNLVFSVDSAVKEEYEDIRRGAKFDKVVSNIIRFNEIRKNEYPDSKIRTRISMIVCDDVQNVEYARTFWSAMVDEFAYRKVIDRLNIYSNMENSSERPCSLLWERLYVWFDGTVSICDEDYKSNLSPGNVNLNSIHDIWHGDVMEKIRQIHLDHNKNSLNPCSKCPGF